ncbi:MAG: rRNA maturation RNase YbeY [Candidatus Paceibacterota bacterium]
MADNFFIANETEEKLPFVDFEAMKKTILDKNYHLNLIIAPPEQLKKLNTIYRNKETATDILSFPLSETEGEIYICPEETHKEAAKFGRTYENFLAFLFIHGCLHLKGHDHGAKMEKEEEKIRKEFGI